MSSSTVAPNVDPTQGGSSLANALAPSAPTVPQYDPSEENATSDALSGPQSGGEPSRLKAILSAVANVSSTAMAGIPDKGRESAFTGLGEGARASQAAAATQQQIKMANFDQSVRLANLHAQDQELQLRTQEQQDAHQKAQDFQADWDNDHGIDYDPHPNDGTAVMQTLKAQTAANGSASIAPGTHLSADGNTINVPSNSQETQDGMLVKYKQLQGVLPGLPNLPRNAQFVPDKNMDILTHLLGGYDVAGNPINHDQLPAYLSAMQAQRDALAKKGATSYQLGTIDNTIGILEAQQNALDEHAATVTKNNAQSKKSGEIAAQLTPEGQALDQRNQANKIAAQDNAAANRPQKADTQMYVGTDPSGNQIAGTTADLQSAGAQGVTKLDADAGKKVITARQLISPNGLFAQIAQDMDNLNAKGKLGSSMTARFNDAMLNKAGADPDYAPLFVHTHLLSTALMQAHVGSRGSSDMMNEFKQLADSGKMNAQTLAASLSAERRYVKEKAMLPKPIAQSGGAQ